ncbi:hypothetical protein CC80DRAFT_591382 [Byssothecium circinans]|uniref:Uncharacterized protein n=1 Tax=Byssothecium circinans TaxID=147558 RepID=A0A6A5U3S6_9PLEO|nr:hypothetical protein CC80DRAFT_591382 [Byssothecium circinans]
MALNRGARKRKARTESPLNENDRPSKKQTAASVKGPTDESKVEDTRAEISKQNPLRSPLLRLPRELRDEIYGYALGGDRWEIEAHGKAKSPKCNALGLLRVCRQISQEASATVFTSNTIAFRNAKALVRFIAGANNRLEMTTIELEVSSLSGASYYNGFGTVGLEGCCKENVSIFRRLPILKGVHIHILMLYLWGCLTPVEDSDSQNAVKALQERIQLEVPDVSVTCGWSTKEVEIQSPSDEDDSTLDDEYDDDEDDYDTYDGLDNLDDSSEE